MSHCTVRSFPRWSTNCRSKFLKTVLEFNSCSISSFHSVSSCYSLKSALLRNYKEDWNFVVCFIESFLVCSSDEGGDGRNCRAFNGFLLLLQTALKKERRMIVVIQTNIKQIEKRSLACLHIRQFQKYTVFNHPLCNWGFVLIGRDPRYGHAREGFTPMCNQNNDKQNIAFGSIWR